MIAIIAFAVSKNVKKGDEPQNASRRDDAQTTAQGSDEDLLALDGSSQGQDRPADAASDETSAAESQLGNSPIMDDANRPVSDDVQVVRKILIPEAVVIGSGDIGSFYSNEEYMDVVPVDISSFSEADVPSKYDSRDVDGNCYITAVEDQGYTYLCWTYAALGAVESDILKHNPDISYKDIDLSEKHLAYYNLHQAEGSLGGLIDGDFRELVNADDVSNDWIFDYDTGYVACGGVTNFCISLLTAWKGPVQEEGDDAFKSIYGSSYLFTDNANVPSDGYKSDYHVQCVDQIPAVYENNLLIKQMVMEHGSATIGVNADSRFWRDHNSTLYASYDGNTALIPNHEVLIIGWDDDYSASNFVSKPDKDGAWLCKNSWGTGVGKGGCFWLSYYDETVSVSNAASYETALKGDDNYYDNNYQAAGFLSNVVSTLDDSLNTVRAYTASSNPYGMLYTAENDETLKAVGFMSIDLYQQYELLVYLNPSEIEGEVEFGSDNEPVVSQKISAISGGYHTFELDKDIDLKKGDKFFVLIKPETDGRLVFEEAEDMVGEANYDEWQNLTGNIHNNYEASKLSYYISDDGNSMVRQDDKDFFVKAYTVNR